jgi:predicted esterase
VSDPLGLSSWSTWVPTPARALSGFATRTTRVAARRTSWLLHVPGLWSLTDWPELTAMGRSRFLVQYRIDDELFPRAGMEAAHDHLLRVHAGTMRYRGSFIPGGHSFDVAMQNEAWAFLAEALH